MREQMIRLLFAAVFLWAAAIPDIRTKKIPLWIPRVFAVPAVISAAVFPTDLGRISLWFGVIPGLLFMALAIAARGRLGMGDGICMSVCGLIIGISEIVEVILWAFLAAGIAAAWFIVIRKQSGKNSIPFIPFLASGCCAELIISIGYCIA